MPTSLRLLFLTTVAALRPIRHIIRDVRVLPALMAALLLVILSLAGATEAHAQRTAISKSFAPTTFGFDSEFAEVVLFGTNGVTLNQGGQVSGDVVVNDAGFVLLVDRNNVVNGNLKADNIEIKRGAVINGDVFFNDLDNDGTINGVENPGLALPVFEPPPFQVANPRPDAPDVSVGSGQTTVLAPGDYGDITVAPNGTVVFSGGIYDVRSLTGGQSSIVDFSASVDLRVLGRLDIGKNSVVGSSSGIAASEIIIYVAGVDGPGGFAADIGRDSEVTANIYAALGTVNLDQGTDATGAFLGVVVIVNKNSTVELDSYFFNRPPVANAQDVFTNGEEDLEIILTGSDTEGGGLTFSTSALQFPGLGTLSSPVLIIPDPIGRCMKSNSTCDIDADCPGTDTCQIQQPPATSASVTYSPNTDENLENSFTFDVTDSEGEVSAPALVQINPVGDVTVVPPVTEISAFDVDTETVKDTPVEITLEGEAPDGVDLTFSIESGPTSGGLSGLADVPPNTAMVTYTPGSGFEGTDSFDFKACNINDPGDCATATATINVFDPAPPAPDPNTVTLDDQTVQTPQNTPVPVTLTATTSTTANQYRIAAKAQEGTEIGAAIAGNVADSNDDGIGDNRNSLPGGAPVFMAAAVDQSGGPGSNGIVRMQFEWDIANLSGTQLESAEVLLHTSKGAVDILDTEFFAGTDEQDGLLGLLVEEVIGDFEAPVDEETVLATMPVVPGDDTFEFDVAGPLQEALNAGRSFFSIQGRVDEGLAGQGSQRGLQVRTTATGNLNGSVCPVGLTSCEPMLIINADEPPVLEGAVFTVQLLISTAVLPQFGVLTYIDENGREITFGEVAQPPLPNGTTLRYTPNLGYSGPDNFQVTAQLKEAAMGVIATSQATMFFNVGTPLAQPSVEMQNHPNPFNPTTTISFAVPEASPVKLVIYDVLGRQIRVLVDGALEAGTHEATFEAGDLPSGLYLYRLETPQGSFVKTMMLLK